MVLNPNGIEPTFLKLKKKSVLCIQKTFTAVFKNGLNPVLGSIPRLPIDRVDKVEQIQFYPLGNR